MLSSYAHAESTALTNENIQGSWKLDYTKQNVNATEQTKREDTWVFSKGSVTILNIPRAGGYFDQLPVSYEIEDNKLKVGILGRTGRFDKFSLINKDDNHMTLKARFGEIYQFIKK